MKEKLYLLRIAVKDIEPEIWRRFAVPADIPLDRLHDVVQVVMGWEECHLHEFIIDKKRYTELPETENDLDEATYRLSDLITQNGQTFDYHYDFSDDWWHEIILEDHHYSNDELISSVECIDGERSCPPEDIGGIPGYEELCREIAEAKEDAEERGEEWDEWGEEYDSEEFDLDTVNAELLIYQRWARDRKIPWTAG